LFLILIGIVNLVVLVGTIKVFRRMRSGHFDEAELADRLHERPPVGPVLFVAGMSLFDSLFPRLPTGVWACAGAPAPPGGRVLGGLVRGGLSRLIIGVIEIVSIFTSRLGIDSGPLAAIGNLDLNSLVAQDVVRAGAGTSRAGPDDPQPRGPARRADRGRLRAGVRREAWRGQRCC